MNLQLKKGFSFGLTSGIITTLGMIVGLDATTGSKTVVIGGIIIIAVADALSDSLGMHISQESTNKHTAKEIWQSTASTFFSKFFFAMTFIFPFLVFSLRTSIIISICYGLTLIILFSVYLANQEHEKPYKVVIEHLLITILVIVITYLIGNWVGKTFT